MEEESGSLQASNHKAGYSLFLVRSYMIFFTYPYYVSVCISGQLEEEAMTRACERVLVVSWRGNA